MTPKDIDYSKHIRRESSDTTSSATGSQPYADDVAVRPDLMDSYEQGKNPYKQSGLKEVLARLFGGDRVLWVIIIALMTISVLVVYSSTAKMAYNPRSALTTEAFLSSQLALLAICIVALFAVHRINSSTYRRFSLILWVVAVGLTTAVYFTGATTNGAARWISIAGFQFQPSEMLKIALVMFLARQLAARQSTIRETQIVPSILFWTWGSDKQRRIWREGGLPIFAPIVLTCMVIMPAHTSSAVLAFVLSLAMLYIGRVRWLEIFRIIGWALVGVALVGLLGLGRSKTAGGRISTWVDLWTTDRTEIPVEDLSDTERSMIAIYNGGILGRGAGQSAVRVEMTHPESDYAFAFFVEEYGIVMAMILVALYVWVFFRAIEIFERCPKKYPALLSLGIALLITGQALLHIMVTVNIIPETGQTLPLISRGGSSLLFTSIGLGMILSVSRQTQEGSHTD